MCALNNLARADFISKRMLSGVNKRHRLFKGLLHIFFLHMFSSKFFQCQDCTPPELLSATGRYG
jgi:hypothetical protein